MRRSIPCTVLFTLNAALLFGCGGGVTSTTDMSLDMSSEKFFEVDSRYERQVPDCTVPEAIDCVQYATFSHDGSAFVLLTDVGNSGQHEIQGQKIAVSFVTSGDAGSSMTFTLSPNRKTIINDSDGITWNLKPQ